MSRPPTNARDSRAAADVRPDERPQAVDRGPSEDRVGRWGVGEAAAAGSLRTLECLTLFVNRTPGVFASGELCRMA